jgi:hypothetical protein
MNDATTKALVEWSLDNNYVILADGEVLICVSLFMFNFFFQAFATVFSFRNDADRSNYGLRWKLAKFTETVRNCEFDDEKSFEAALTSLNKLVSLYLIFIVRSS